MVFQTEQRPRSPDQNRRPLIRLCNRNTHTFSEGRYSSKAISKIMQIFMTKDVQLDLWSEHIILIIVINRDTLFACVCRHFHKLTSAYSVCASLITRIKNSFSPFRPFTFISKSCKVHLTKSIITSVELTALVKLPVAILYMYVACLSVMQPSPIQSESQRVNMIQMVQGKYDLCYIN